MKRLIVVLIMLGLFVACTPTQTVPQPETGIANPDIKESKLSGYIPYNPALFKQASTSDKVIYLEFYAAWCPFCRALDPIIKEAFATLESDGVNVVGFQVNFDKETDLRKEYGVTYQHTHILIKDGKVVWRSLVSDLTKEELITQVKNVA